MTISTIYALSVASGTVGASHTVDSQQSSQFIGGQPLWLSFFYKATRTVGTDVLVLRAKVRWWNSANTELTATFLDISINATIGDTFSEFKHISPAAAVKCALQFVLTPAASPMQHTVEIKKVRLGRTQVAADITASVVGITSASFAHGSAGVAESGQFPRDIPFSLVASGATITSGLTWTYTVKVGTVNGFTSASGAQSIVGAGSINLVVSSLGSDNATVQVNATYNGVAYPFTISLDKAFAAPAVAPAGGSSGSSMTSGFGNLNSAINTYSTTAGDTVGALSATLAAGKTAVDVAVNLSARPDRVAPDGSNNIEFKLQRKIAGTYTDVLTSQNSNPDATVDIDPETGIYFVAELGSLVYTFNDTGLAASATYEYRVQSRWTTGAAAHTPFNFTGSVVVTVP